MCNREDVHDYNRYTTGQYTQLYSACSKTSITKWVNGGKSVKKKIAINCETRRHSPWKYLVRIYNLSRRCLQAFKKKTIERDDFLLAICVADILTTALHAIDVMCPQDLSQRMIRSTERALFNDPSQQTIYRRFNIKRVWIFHHRRYERQACVNLFTTDDMPVHYHACMNLFTTDDNQHQTCMTSFTTDRYSISSVHEFVYDGRYSTSSVHDFDYNERYSTSGVNVFFHNGRYPTPDVHGFVLNGWYSPTKDARTENW